MTYRPDLINGKYVAKFLGGDLHGTFRASPDKTLVRGAPTIQCTFNENVAPPPVPPPAIDVYSYLVDTKGVAWWVRRPKA